MAYSDFDFYKNVYFGDELTEDNAPKYLEHASDEVCALTFDRLTKSFPTIEAHAVKVKKAVCAVAEILYLVDCQKKAVSAQKTEDGNFRGAVSSVSSGRESISYATNGTASSVYASAAASTQALNDLVRDTAVKYLANVPDSNGVNLLYAGGC